LNIKIISIFIYITLILNFSDSIYHFIEIFKINNLLLNIYIYAAYALLFPLSIQYTLTIR